jgi:hypothetical protein
MPSEIQKEPLPIFTSQGGHHNIFYNNRLAIAHSKYLAFIAHFLYYLGAFDSFRAPSQYKHLRLTQRVTFLQKTLKVSALHQQQRNQYHHGNRNSEVV